MSGCQLFKQEAPDDAIAVVGDEWITHDDVVDELTVRGISATNEREYAHFVNKWIDTQLLLHEARQLKLHKNAEIQARLERLETELLVSALLDSNTVVEDPTSQSVIDYWKDHTGEYTRVANEVTLVIAYVNSRNSAWRVREAFDQSSPVSQMREESGLQRVDTLRNLSVDRLPEVIAKGIEPLRTGHSSLPIEYNGDWMIVKLLERLRAGRPRSIEEVESIVRARMVAERKSRLKMDYLEELRREARESGFVRIRFTEPEREPVSTSSEVQSDSLLTGTENPAIEE